MTRLRLIKIADGAVVNAAIFNGAVNSTKLADPAVSTTKIFDDAVTTAKIASGAVTATELATDAVTTVKIQDAAVTNAKLAIDSVAVDNIVDSAVGAAQIADGAVSTAKIADAAVGTVKIASGAITTDRIANTAVTTPKLSLTGVSAGTYTSVTVGTDGRVTAGSSQQVETFQVMGENDGTWPSRGTWFLPNQYRNGSGQAIQGIFTAAISLGTIGDKSSRFPITDDAGRFSGTAYIEGFIFTGGAVPAGAQCKVAIWESDIDNITTNPSFTNAARSAAITLTKATDTMTRIPRQTLTWTAAANKMYCIAVENASSTTAITTATSYASLKVSFELD